MPGSTEVARPIVVVDSNALVHGAWRADSAAWRVLLHQSKSGQINLVVPEVVVREVVGRCRDEMKKRADGATRAAQKLNELTGKQTLTEVELAIEDLVAAYEAHIRAVLAEHGVAIAPIPDLDIEGLVQRAIDRGKPFDEKGSGFRDSVLWECLVVQALSHPTSHVYLISKDARAFADTGQEGVLHPHLAQELAERGVTAKAELVDEIAGYLDGIGVGDAALVAAVMEQLAVSQPDLVAAAVAALVDRELRSTSPSVHARITSADEVEVGFEHAGGVLADEGLLLVHLSVGGRASAELQVDDQATPIVGSVEFSLSARATASYDRAARLFADLQVEVPAIEDVPAVVAELLTIDSSAVRPAGMTEWIAALRALQSWQPPPELVETLRAMQTLQPSPEVVEAMRIVQKFQPPPAVLEALRTAQKFRPPAALLDAMRAAQKLPRVLGSREPEQSDDPEDGDLDSTQDDE